MIISTLSSFGSKVTVFVTVVEVYGNLDFNNLDKNLINF